MPETPEQQARREIDRQLTAAGWLVQDKRHLNLHAGPGVALCETDVDGGFADYMLFVDAKALGVLEAKAAGTPLVGVAEQSELYARAALTDFQRWGDPLPFTYESNGEENRFRDLRDPRSRSRFVFSIHRPETLRTWIEQRKTLRARLQNLPPLIVQNLRACQVDAGTGIEKSLARQLPRCLVQSATGSGIGHGGIGDDFVPLLDRILAGNEGRAIAAAVVEDLEQIAVLSGPDGRDTQIVHDQHAGFLNALEQLGQAAVGVSLLQSTEELGSGEIGRAEAMVLVETLRELGEETIHRYRIFNDGWDWGHLPCRIQLKAMARVMEQSMGINTPLYRIAAGDLEAILEGRRIPRRHLLGSPLTEPSLEDYALSTVESRKAKETEELPAVLEYIQAHRLESLVPNPPPNPDA